MKLLTKGAAAKVGGGIGGGGGDDGNPQPKAVALPLESFGRKDSFGG